MDRVEETKKVRKLVPESKSSTLSQSRKEAKEGEV